jgi:hypothetical protein
MLNLTREVVLKKAVELIKISGITTTEEIKLSLRLDGYFAQQATVSQFMDEGYSEFDLTYDFNGKYRVYKLDETPDEEIDNEFEDEEDDLFDEEIIDDEDEFLLKEIDLKKVSVNVYSQGSLNDHEIYNTENDELIYIDESYTHDTARLVVREFWKLHPDCKTC